MNAILDVIKKRRSVRKYKPDQLKAQELELILEAGRLAPSGHNNQTSHFVVVQDPAVLDALREVVRAAFAKMELPEDSHHPMSASIRLSKKGTYNFMYNPPTLVIAANRRGYGNAMADCALALGNMMLMASSIGIGTCWINQLRWLSDDEAVMQAVKKLGIGETEVICGALAIGYSDQPEVPPTARRGNTVDFIR